MIPFKTRPQVLRPANYFAKLCLIVWTFPGLMQPIAGPSIRIGKTLIILQSSAINTSGHIDRYLYN